jgi:hypothetical protein
MIRWLLPANDSHPSRGTLLGVDGLDDGAMRLVCPTCLGVGHIAEEQHTESVYGERIGWMVVYAICRTCDGLSWLYDF